MELGGRHRPVQPRADEEVADVGVGLEQDGRRKEDVVDPDDAVLVQLHVVDERRAAVQREVQRVVQVVIEVGAGADDEVDQAALHHLDDAAAKPAGVIAPAIVSADRRVVLGREHLVRENRGRPPTGGRR